MGCTTHAFFMATKGGRPNPPASFFVFLVGAKGLIVFALSPLAPHKNSQNSLGYIGADRTSNLMRKKGRRENKKA